MRTIRIFLLVLLIPLFPLLAMEGSVDAVFPDRAKISWSPVPGAAHYDIYLGKVGLKRLPPTVGSFLVGGGDGPLSSHTSYQVLVAARDGEDNTISYVRLVFRTTGWEGIYRWKNPTDDDNGGKCRSMKILVDDRDGQWRIWGDFGEEGRVLLFPLAELADEYPTVPYDSGTAAAKAYRLNASMFNTTSYTPKSWRIVKMESGPASVTTVIETKVWAMRFSTSSTFHFRISETGEKQAVLENEGKGIASWGMFRCPEKGSGGAFVFAWMGPLP